MINRLSSRHRNHLEILLGGRRSPPRWQIKRKRVFASIAARMSDTAQQLIVSGRIRHLKPSRFSRPHFAPLAEPVASVGAVRFFRPKPGVRVGRGSTSKISFAIT